jgi:hypothetical protein
MAAVLSRLRSFREKNFQWLRNAASRYSRLLDPSAANVANILRFNFLCLAG